LGLVSANLADGQPANQRLFWGSLKLR
jgi:hypothetical protein